MLPRNALCKFQRASILHSVDRNQEALEELTQLKAIVPKESPVYFLIGKVGVSAGAGAGSAPSWPGAHQAEQHAPGLDALLLGHGPRP